MKNKPNYVEIAFGLLVIIMIAALALNSWFNVKNEIVYPVLNNGQEAVSVVPVTGATGLVNLACESATVIKINDGNSIIFPKLEPCGLSVSAGDVKEQELPAKLPSGVQFVDATTVNVIDNGKTIVALPNNKKVSISFANNASLLGTKNFIGVLRWAESEWKEVAFDSRLRAFSNELGLFVLVKR